MDEERINGEENMEKEPTKKDAALKKVSEAKDKIKGLPKKKKIIFGIIIALVLIFVIKGCTSGDKASGIQAAYTYTTATRTSITEVISGSGTLEPADKYTVTTLLKGDVLEANFEEGDIVNEDEILYQIDSSDMETTIERAELSASAAERNYNTALKNLDNLNVKSKVNGVVTDVLVEVGDNVMAGQEVARVRDNSVMTLELTFPADEADTFYIGQEAMVTLYGSFEVLSGRVTSVSGATEVLTGNMMVKEVEISVDNPGAITDTQIATAEIGSSGSTQSGTFKFKTSRSVFSEVSGEVIAIISDEGANVYNGSTIISLESDAVTNAFEAAEDGVRDSELNIENLNDTLEDYTITSPISGTIIEKKVKAGDTIDTAAHLCTIYDLSYLKMTMNIDELDIKKISVGQEVSITADAIPDEVFIGKVTKINLAGTTVNGVTTYPVEVQIADIGGLLPGMNVSTEMVVNHVDDVIAVPVEAVIRGDKVLVNTGSNSEDKSIPKGYEYITVDIGISDGMYTEVISGINENDEIAYIPTSGNSMLDMMQGMMG